MMHMIRVCYLLFAICEIPLYEYTWWETEPWLARGCLKDTHTLVTSTLIYTFAVDQIDPNISGYLTF